MTVAFVSHGAPTLAIDEKQGAPLREWGAALGRPRALLVVSAHWEASPLAFGTLEPKPLLYDFYGFPPELYAVKYPAPGAPSIATELTSRLPSWAPVPQPERPWDHGVWTPLVHLFPKADIPVLQLSLPSRESPRRLFELGRSLAPLVAEGVLLLGSGSMTHNLRQLDPGSTAPHAWAEAFDTWVAEVLQRSNWDALLGFRAQAPGLRYAHPTEEHFLPLLIVAGAASVLGGQATFPIEGFEMGSLSRRCVQWG